MIITGFKYNKSPIISVIQLWQEHTPDSQTHALRLLGQQLQKQLGIQGRSNSFYFPSELCDNAVMWQLMLRDILKIPGNCELAKCFRHFFEKSLMPLPLLLVNHFHISLYIRIIMTYYDTKKGYTPACQDGNKYAVNSESRCNTMVMAVHLFYQHMTNGMPTVNWTISLILPICCRQSKF